MKIILLLACLIALGCGHKKQPEAKRHFYFVGYVAIDGSRSTYSGFMSKSDTMPHRDTLKDRIWRNLCYNDNYFDKDRIVILSISEFADSVSAYKFMDSDTAGWGYCEPHRLEFKSGSLLKFTTGSEGAYQIYDGNKWIDSRKLSKQIK